MNGDRAQTLTFILGNGHQTQTFSIILETVKLTDAFDAESNLQNLYGGRTFNIKERLSFQPSNALSLTARGGYFNRTSTRINYDDHYIDYTAGLRGVWNIGVGKTLELSYSYDQYDKQRYVNDRHPRP